MKFFNIAAAATVLASALAKNVACNVNGQTVAVVDLDSGKCPFTVPSPEKPIWAYTDVNNYIAQFYYAIAQNIRYFSDALNAGDTISIPAIALYGGAGCPLFRIHSEKHLNSTAGAEKRLLAGTFIKRDAESDLAEALKSEDGVEVPGVLFEVVDLASSSSGASTTGATGASGAGTSTVTNESTKIITITSCSENKCSETTVPATEGPTTVTSNGVVTTYTTWCPLTGEPTSTVTEESTKIVTITSCSENKCSETTVPATEGPTTVTINGVVTTYTTWCPLTAESTSYTVVTVTSCSDNKCAPVTITGTEAVTTGTVEGTVTTYTTIVPVTVESEATTPAVSTFVTESGSSTVAAASQSVSIYAGAAVKVTGSLLALVAIPLAYLL